MADTIFQINDIDFIVPPTSISVYKEGLNYSVKSLRTKSSVKIASGNGIYHAQINLTIPPKELLALHRLICQVKNNPFVCVNNNFLKESLETKEEYENAPGNYLYFTLMGLNINNHPSSPGSFIVELDLRYFNSKPYMENLSFFDDINGGDFDIGFNTNRRSYNKIPKKVISGDPKESFIYVRYSNYLQILYLKKYFKINLKEEDDDDGSPLIKIADQLLLQAGRLGLHDIEGKEKIIELIYGSSKYTQIKNRNFINLKLSAELAGKLKEAITNNITSNMSTEDRYKQREANVKALKLISENENSIPGSLYFSELVGPFNCRYEKATDTVDLQADGEYKKEYPRDFTDGAVSDFTSYGKITVDFPKEGSDLVTLKVEHLLTDEGSIETNKTDQKEHSPYIYTPTKTKFVTCVEEGKQSTLRLETLGFDKPYVFQIKVVNPKGVKFIYFNHKTKDSKKVIPNQTIIGIADQKAEYEVTMSKELFEKMPMLKRYREKQRENALLSQKNFSKQYEELEKFLSENYQPYLDRKDSKSNIYESVLGVNFLDYKDYELNTLLGENRTRREGGVDFEYDKNTIITSINGSLRHITPSIPILGQETPTHQFLGSMEPNYQISLIGKGVVNSEGILNKMPDSFLNLEKQRKDSQENAKRFNEIPDVSNFAIDSLITKLLGSYESSEHFNSTIQLGGVDIDYYREKYNFSINSTNTFTVEGQPNTYGMNIHFQETRSYKEEEIRPAFTNYTNKYLSAKFFNTVLGSGIEIPDKSFKKDKAIQGNPTKLTPRVAAKPKPKPKKEVKEELVNENYNWMDWKTKHITSVMWYHKPKSYTETDQRRLADPKKQIDISIPLEEEMQKVKKYLVDSNRKGKLWIETKKRGEVLFKKLGETDKNSQSFMDPDRCAYELCKIMSEIFAYMQVIFPNVRLSIQFTSTLRINSDKNYVAKRGNHKVGGAADIKIIGVNQTELGIYIHLMQILGYIKDPIPALKRQGQSERTGAFLAMGFYQSPNIYRRNKLGSVSGWLHLDLNAVARKFIVTDEDKEYVFHVPSRWLTRRSWGSDGYPLTGANSLGYLLYDQVKTVKSIDSNVNIINKLKKYDKNYKSLKEYKEDLINAHKTLYGESSKQVKNVKEAEDGKTLINFWNDKLKQVIFDKTTDGSIQLDELELRIPDDACGANLTIVNGDQRYKINLYNRDKTFIDWYPASMVKFIGAIGSAYNILLSTEFINIEKIKFKFKLNTNKIIPTTYRDILYKALLRSENPQYSLLVAIGTHKYINDVLLKDSTVVLRRPIWNGKTNYSKSVKRWYGYADIKVEGENSDTDIVEEVIPYLKGSDCLSKTVIHKGVLRTSEGTVEDFSKLMIDFIEGVYPSDVQEKIHEGNLLEYADVEEENKIHNAVKIYLAADKGKPPSPQSTQNALKKAIKDNLAENYKVYHKPGLAKAPINASKPNGPQENFVSDCLYFKTEDEKKDSFGITLWGRVASNASAANRNFLTSESYHGDGKHVSLTRLLAYCMEHSALLKEYMGES